MQTGLGLGGVPRANLVQSSRMSGANQQDVALAHRDALLTLGRLQVLSEDVLARLEPGHTPQARNVEQDAAPYEPILERLDRVDSGAPLGDRILRPVVVEQTSVANVAERVDVGVTVVVVVEADVILDEVDRFGNRGSVTEPSHVMIRGGRAVGRAMRVQRQAQCHAAAVSHEPRRCRDPIRRQQVKRPALVIGSPASPVAEGIEQRLEVPGTDARATHLRPPPPAVRADRAPRSPFQRSVEPSQFASERWPTPRAATARRCATLATPPTTRARRALARPPTP